MTKYEMREQNETTKQSTEVITDRFGRTVKVGDTIVTRPAANSSAYLLVCEVKNIKVKRDGTKIAEMYWGGDTIKREPYQLVKLEKLN
jgi:hypothetical protein